MLIKIHSISSCTTQKLWGNEPAEVLCKDGLLLLFDRQQGCKTTTLRKLASEVVDWLIAYSHTRPNDTPLTVVLSYNSPDYYNINWLAHSQATTLDRKDAMPQGPIDMHMPTNAATPQLHMDVAPFLNASYNMLGGLLEAGLGISLEDYMKMFPAYIYPLPTIEDVHCCNCLEKLNKQLSFYLSKNTAAADGILLAQRIEWLMYAYAFEWSEEVNVQFVS